MNLTTSTVYPAGQITTTSFNVVDQTLQYYNNVAMYPNMKQAIVAGHTLDAQMIQRYAAVGKDLGLNIRVIYWIARPDNYVWFNSDRPVNTGTCTDFNNWRDGKYTSRQPKWPETLSEI